MLLKNKFKYMSLGLGLVLSLGSCKKALDINDNPNQATYSTPELVLPQAIVQTARNVVPFNTAGMRLMYIANASGVSGWGGGFLDYNWPAGHEAGRWADAYNNLTDYQYVVTNSDGVEGGQAFIQAAEIMKAYNYMNLVDTYNDVPYSEALQGTANLHPKYDKGTDIYADLAKKLDAAIAFFKTAEVTPAFVTADVLFKGDTKNWARFANTLKLKLVIKGKGKVTFASEAIDAIGIITDDAIVNPKFTNIDGKNNPMWNSWAYNPAGAGPSTWGIQFIPTRYVMSFYDGYKIDDEGRADLIYQRGVNAPQNQLGDLDVTAVGLAPSTWVLSPLKGNISASNYRGYGVTKGPTAGQPVMLAAEANFLAAEAVVRGIMTGNAKTYFEDGIKASYLYLNKGETDVVANGANANEYLTKYKGENPESALVNFDLATTNEKKTEAIITQKFIAFNLLFSHEGWNEFRRTNYPSIRNPANNQIYLNNKANARNTFVSIQSAATSPDKLPTRFPYPNTEVAYNGSNVPSVDKFTSKIFWAK